MNHKVLTVATAAMVAAGTLSTMAAPAQALPRRGCGTRAGETIAAQVTGTGEVYCVMAEAKDVTLSVHTPVEKATIC